MRTRALAVLLLLFLVPGPVSAASYTVRRGDTLTAIARQYHTSLGLLARINHIGNWNLIQAGRALMIPDYVATASQVVTYRVRWGDTLGGISERFGVPVSSIRALNRLGPYLLAGSVLRLCRACTGTSVGSSVSDSGGSTTYSGRYTVHPGDSLSGIASRFGVTTSALMGANAISNPNRIVIGSILTVPAGSTGQSASSGYDPGSAQSLIATWAQNYGIGAALPLAVAWEESGYNQTLVSSTGAIGVMQVEPATGAVVSNLLGRSLNLYDTNDNIQAGVFWLAHLLAHYGGDQRMAAAAYYEGTQSIARYGLFSDTVQYVDNVVALEGRVSG